MTNMEKIPMKMAEISVRKFNEEAIPYHLGLLSNHKSNIEKSLALRDWEKIKREEINATRVIKQLKNLLIEMESLRNKIRDDDVPKFDALTNKSRRNAIESIQEFVDLKLRSPDKSRSPTTSSLYENEDLDSDLPPIEADFQLSAKQLKAREDSLIEFEHLHREVEDIHSLFTKFSETVYEQAESVDRVGENVEVAEEMVEQGESNLRTALRYKKAAMYPICGALIGTCIGGPVGLFVGLKAGGLAAVGCGILGFTGGTVIKKKHDDDVTALSSVPDVNNKED